MSQSRRIDRFIWAMIATVAAIVLGAPLMSNFHIVWGSFAAPLGAATALAAGAWFYRRRRPDPKLASALESTAQVIAFAAVGAPLSYLAASANLPLIDHVFAGMDHALGLDWKSLLGFMNAHPTVYDLLGPIYLSLTLQMTTVVLCLAFTGRLSGVRIYTLAFIFAALTTIALSAVLPAAGAWPFYGLSSADSAHVLPAVHTSWPVFFGLRDGTERALVAIGSEGIITFPSLHAALAVIMVAAMWPIAALRWPILLLDLAMLAATPIDGSHFFVDVLAGLALAVLCLAAARAVTLGADRSNAPVPARTIAPLGAGE